MKHISGIPGLRAGAYTKMICTRKGIYFTRGIIKPWFLPWDNFISVGMEWEAEEILDVRAATLFAGVMLFVSPVLMPIGLLFRDIHEIPIIEILCTVDLIDTKITLADAYKTTLHILNNIHDYRHRFILRKDMK